MIDNWDRLNLVKALVFICCELVIQRHGPILTFLTSAAPNSSMNFLFSEIFAFERGKPLIAAAAARTDDPSCNNNGSKD